MIENGSLDVKFSEMKSDNPTIDRVKVYIAYPDKNRKKFDIPDSVFKEAENTLKGCPIVGYYSSDNGDYLGHEDDIVKKKNGGYIKTPEPHPIGYVADDIEPWTEVIEDKEYYVAVANLWTTRYPEAKRLLDGKNWQSMEVLFAGGTMVDGYYRPNAMQYIGLCALGENVTPTFNNAGFKAFSDNFAIELAEMMESIKSSFAKGEEKSTPAKPSERIKGSSKNKEGSASTTKGGIKISESTEKTLKNKVDEHNDKHGEDKGKKVTLGMLKAVYRRGAGAYSTSHRPNVSSREQWALGRVNAFLKLIRSGTPSDSDYTQDNDLLPKGHKKKTSKMSIDWLSELIDDISVDFNYDCTEEEIDDIYEYFAEEYEESFATPNKYDHINFKPTNAMKNAVKRGIKMRESQPDSNKCCTPTGLARGSQILRGEPLSPKTVKRMKSFFDRHAVDKQSESWKKGNSKGEQSHLYWGGDPGYRWAKKIVSQMEKADEKANMSIDNKEDFADSIKVSTDPKKVIDGTVGEKNIGEMKKKVLNAPNRASIIPKIFARYPDDLSGDLVQDDLGYPLMSERDGVFYYNTGFVKGASSRIEQNKDQPYYSNVRSRIVDARKKLGMSEKFNFMEGGQSTMEKMAMMQKMAMDMYEKYGMRYMPYAMDEKYMYAMDTEKDMAKMMIPYAMEEGNMAMDYEKMMAMDYDDMEMALKTAMGVLKDKLMEMKSEKMGMMEKYSTMEKELEEVKTNLSTADEKLEKYSNLEKEFDEEKAKVLQSVIEMKASIEEKDAKLNELTEANEKFSTQLKEIEEEKKVAETKAILDKEIFSCFSVAEKEKLMEDLKDCSVEEFEVKLQSKAFSKYVANDAFNSIEPSTFSVMSNHTDKAKTEDDDDSDEDKDVFDKL